MDLIMIILYISCFKHYCLPSTGPLLTSEGRGSDSFQHETTTHSPQLINLLSPAYGGGLKKNKNLQNLMCIILKVPNYNHFRIK